MQAARSDPGSTLSVNNRRENAVGYEVMERSVDDTTVQRCPIDSQDWNKQQAFLIRGWSKSLVGRINLRLSQRVENRTLNRDDEAFVFYLQKI